jgi:poly-beta-hydroxybutyrate-responsive repressor
MDLNACPCSGKTLARLVQPAVMVALHQEPLHGYLLVQRLASMPMFLDQTPDATGVYRILKIMEHQGLVTSSWQLADTGPAKRQFALTDCGQSCLAKWAATMHLYQHSIAELLALLDHAVQPAADRSLS